MGNDSSQPLKYGERLDNDINVNWNKVTCPNPFPPREAHCSCSLNNKLYVFGGVVADGAEPIESNDLLIYDLGKEARVTQDYLIALIKMLRSQRLTCLHVSKFTMFYDTRCMLIVEKKKHCKFNIK